MTDTKNAVEASLSARFSSRLPSARLIMLPEPWPNMRPIACSINVSVAVMPMAPLALVPNRLTKKVSAML